MSLGSLFGIGSYHKVKYCIKYYGLDGEVPETIISGQTSDISPFAELEWYEWVKWRDTGSSYPEDKVSLGKYLGPSVDVGPAMAIKILKENGEIIRLSSYRSLTPDEISSPQEQQDRATFDAKIQEKLGSEMTLKDLNDQSLDAETPVCEPYEDDDDGLHE